MTVLDVAIVGAGPAGLAAATACAERGLSVSLYDEQSAPGGQAYRGITASPLARPDILGDDYWQGARLIAPFARSGARYVPGASVWAIAPRDGGDFDLCVSVGPPGAREAMTIVARMVILATGALERPFPRAGWTLPGVMMAGGAQVLLKTAGVVPQGRTVLAGCGPLLWLVAWQYLRAGVRIEALLDTIPRGRLAKALPHAPAFMASAYFGKGLALVRAVRRRVRFVEYVESIALLGDDSVAAVRFRCDGRDETLAADQVLLHQGVVPDTNLAAAAGCALAWSERDACFAPVVDAWGGSTVPGIYIAGDGAGIAGAEAAEARGRLTALAVANALRTNRWKRARPRCARSFARPGSRDPGPRVSRRALSACGCVSTSGRRHTRVPLRGSVGGDHRAARARRMRRAESDEGVHALRHGAVPGPVLWPDRHRAHGARNRAIARGRRALSSALSGEADHAARACRPCRRRRRPSARSCAYVRLARARSIDLDVRVLRDLAPLHDFRPDERANCSGALPPGRRPARPRCP
jgi:thioredoxin reductase